MDPFRNNNTFGRSNVQGTTANGGFTVESILAKISSDEEIKTDNYEQMQAELEFIADSLNRDETLTLEQKVALYTYASGLYAACMKKLNEIEQKVLKVQKGATGEPEMIAFS